MRNRRKAARWAVEFPCRVSSAGETQSGRVLDVSSDGIRVEFEGPLDGMPHLSCYLNGWTLQRSLDVCWSSRAGNKVVFGARLRGSELSSATLQAFQQMSQWQAARRRDKRRPRQKTA